MSNIDDLRWFGKQLESGQEAQGIDQSAEGAKYCLSAADEIESLTAKVAELEAEVSSLNALNENYLAKIRELEAELEGERAAALNYRQDALAEQSKVKVLTDAIESVCCDADGNVVCFQNQADNFVLQDALATVKGE